MKREPLKARRVVYICAILLTAALTLFGSSFTDYNDIEPVLALLTDILPPELKSSDPAARRKAWPDWLIAHDRDIRQRLLRGDEDTIVNWLLFGTSFTRQSTVILDAPTTSDSQQRLISARTRDFIAALRSTDPNERIAFARRLLRSQGYGFDSSEERTRLERHLNGEIERVVSERQKYMLREEEFQRGDVVGQIMAYSTLFRDRGLSLDTSILPAFVIEQALETMRNQGLLAPNGIRRVAVIGPGLDFADKNSGYDFYPVQTLQPFTSIDSLVRLGLAAGPAEIELTTFDISPRVNDHIQALRDRASTGTPYVLRLPIELGSQWTPALMNYWKSIGDRIGSETPVPRPQEMDKGFGLRGIEVRPQVAARVTPVEFNVVTEKWTGEPFDLVIATNVLVYYDKLDQALAFAAIEGMLRPGGFFVTNNVVVELPVSQLRSVGVLTVRHSAEKIDHVFWYRRRPA
jgi:hypothetical protein